VLLTRLTSDKKIKSELEQIIAKINDKLIIDGKKNNIENYYNSEKGLDIKNLEILASEIVGIVK
jgi:hypothetical protein